MITSALSGCERPNPLPILLLPSLSLWFLFLFFYSWLLYFFRVRLTTTRFRFLDFFRLFCCCLWIVRIIFWWGLGAIFGMEVAAFPITLSLIDVDYPLLPLISPETKIGSNSDSFVLDRLYLIQPSSKHTPLGGSCLIFDSGKWTITVGSGSKI